MRDAQELLNRGYGRKSVDLHLTTEAVTRRLSDMTDAELAALEARIPIGSSRFQLAAWQPCR
jgi:hypothetical protein